MADKFSEIASFVQIASSGSLSAAAGKMGLSLAAVSRRLSQLEARLGTPLLHRTTRALALTEEGHAFYQRASQILTELERAEEDVTRDPDQPVGLLRVTATVGFGRRRLAPLLQEFCRQHPEVQVHLDTSEQAVNVIEGGYDLAIRFGPLPDSSLIVRRLASNRQVICASPDYLRRRGRPKSLSDLADHDCIVVGDGSRWRFNDGVALNLRHPLMTNDGELAHAWVLNGGGLAIKSLWDVEQDLRERRLEVVLSDYELPDQAVNAVYPQSRVAAAKVRRCVAFLAAKLRAASHEGESRVDESAEAFVRRPSKGVDQPETSVSGRSAPSDSSSRMSPSESS